MLAERLWVIHTSEVKGMHNDAKCPISVGLLSLLQIVTVLVMSSNAVLGTAVWECMYPTRLVPMRSADIQQQLHPQPLPSIWTAIIEAPREGIIATTSLKGAPACVWRFNGHKWHPAGILLPMYYGNELISYTINSISWYGDKTLLLGTNQGIVVFEGPLYMNIPVYEGLQICTFGGFGSAGPIHSVGPVKRVLKIYGTNSCVALSATGALLLLNGVPCKIRPPLGWRITGTGFATYELSHTAGILPDGAGGIWTISDGLVIGRWHPKEFKGWKMVSDAPEWANGIKVHSYTMDKEGMIWIGITLDKQLQLVGYDTRNGKWKRCKGPKANGTHLTSLSVAPDGSVIAAAQTMGVLRFTDDGWQVLPITKQLVRFLEHYEADPKTAKPMANIVLVSSKGRLWVANGYWLWCFERDEWLGGKQDKGD